MYVCKLMMHGNSNIRCICFTLAKSSIFIVTEGMAALWHTTEMVKLL